MKFRCRIGLHPWGQWEEIGPMHFDAWNLEGQIVKSPAVLSQKRTCPSCGRSQMKPIDTRP